MMTMAAKKKAKREEKVAEDTFYVRVLDAEPEITGSDLIPDGATIREMAVASMGLPRHEDPPESDDTLHCCGRSPAECEASPGPCCAGTVVAGLLAPDRTAPLSERERATKEALKLSREQHDVCGHFDDCDYCREARESADAALAAYAEEER